MLLDYKEKNGKISHSELENTYGILLPGLPLLPLEPPIPAVPGVAVGATAGPDPAEAAAGHHLVISTTTDTASGEAAAEASGLITGDGSLSNR